MHIARRLHVGENVVLQLGHWLQRVRHILVLLNVTDNFGCLRALGEVDEVGLFDQGGYAVLDEGEVREVDTCLNQLLSGSQVLEHSPKNGMHGGFAL